MAAKNPFDYSAMFRVFNPDDIRGYFDPSRMLQSMFEPAQSAGFDPSGLMEANRRNYEAMIEANKSAAQAYQDLMARQMEVFAQMTSAAREHVAWLDEATGPDALQKKTEAYGEAVEKALTLMRKLADSAREANEEAYASMKGKIDEAVNDLKSRT